MQRTRLLLFPQVHQNGLKLAREAATFGTLSSEKGLQIGALRVLRRVFVSLFTVFADFRQLLNHRNSVILIHDWTSIVSDCEPRDEVG